MEDLSRHIEACGLTPRWKGILKGVGINTIEDLQTNLHSHGVQEALVRHASQEEGEALRVLLYSCECRIKCDLTKHIEACGLTPRWNEILKGLGINTIDELQKSLHTSKIKEELLSQTKDYEKEALSILFYSCELYENPGNNGQDRPILEKTKFDGVAEGDLGTTNALNQKHGEEELLRILGLSSCFPEKITLDMINKKASRKLNSTNDIPWYVLSRLLMCDYRGRDSIISSNIKTQLGNESRNQYIQSVDDLESLFTEVTGEISMNLSYAPHPTDVLAVILKCSSYFVRQIICEKLFLCKLAIPLILPYFQKQRSKIFLWPLRTIVTETYSGTDRCRLVSTLEQSTPVISWLRLGETSLSKSRLLNEILNDQSHPTFFHRDCENGMNKRSVSEGSVELAWQLFKLRNDGAEKVNTNKIILNLRGNGKDWEGTTHFLFKVSNVVIVMVDFKHLENNDISQFLEPMSKYDSTCMIFLTKPASLHIGSEGKRKIRVFIDMLQKMNFTKERIILDFEGGRAKNIKVLKEEIEGKLQLCLKGVTPKGVGKFFKITAKSLKISADEDDSKCIKVREKAQVLQNLINGQETDTVP